MRIETIKLWESRDDVELTMFLHLPDAFLPKQSPRPAMIVCPGGAYQSCPRHGNEGDPVAMAFAIDGYQAFVLEYSVATKAPQEQTLFPAQIVDLGRAVLAVREHANEWGVDPDKISICGFSAGAHLCSMYATTWHNGMLSKKLGADTERFRVMAALPIYGLHDYILQEEARRSGAAVDMGDINTPVFGCANPGEEQLKEYSPVYLATDQTPPMFLAAATDDGAVPAMHTLAMAQKLQRIGVPYECHMFQYGSHGFSLGRNIFEPYKQELTHACAQWVPLAKTFLMHLISPETVEPERDPFADMVMPAV